MKASEIIHLAIAKLEGLQSSSTPGPWTAAAGLDDKRNLEYSLIAPHNFEFFDLLDAVNEDVHKASADADLVEVLHRTIDAQLAILRLALDYGDLEPGHGSRFHRAACNLAVAIIGKA